MKKISIAANGRRSGTRQRKGGRGTSGKTRNSLLPKAALRYFGLSGEEHPGEIRWTIHTRAWEDYLLRMKAAMKSGAVL